MSAISKLDHVHSILDELDRGIYLLSELYKDQIRDIEKFVRPKKEKQNATDIARPTH